MIETLTRMQPPGGAASAGGGRLFGQRQVVAGPRRGPAAAGQGSVALGPRRPVPPRGRPDRRAGPIVGLGLSRGLRPTRLEGHPRPPQDDPATANPARSRARPPLLTEYADDLTMALGRREASVLLVVDQAEELLQGAACDEASAFLSVLRRATERPGGRVFGLLTLRSDFLGSFQNHPALRGVAFADLPLGLLPVENFSQVIEGPADRAEIALEPGLVRSMIADARTDDALPLLAFTLREMYERCRDQARLTLKVYRDDLGGIKGAVARVVERIKTEGTWTPEVGRALRRAFLKLVRVNDEGQFTRQPCRWADLPDQAAPVLEAFVKARLLSSNGDVVEVTHESLFRVWPELAGWLDEGRELMLWKKGYPGRGAGLARSSVLGRSWPLSRCPRRRGPVLARRDNPDDFPARGKASSSPRASPRKTLGRPRADPEGTAPETARNLAIAAGVATILADRIDRRRLLRLWQTRRGDRRVRRGQEGYREGRGQMRVTAIANEKEARKQEGIAKAQTEVARKEKAAALAISPTSPQSDRPSAKSSSSSITFPSAACSWPPRPRDRAGH